MTETSDLSHELAKEKRERFDALLQKYQNRIVVHILVWTTEDNSFAVMDETFRRAFEGFEELEKEEDFMPWMASLIQSNDKAIKNHPPSPRILMRDRFKWWIFRMVCRLPWFRDWEPFPLKRLNGIEKKETTNEMRLDDADS